MAILARVRQLSRRRLWVALLLSGAMNVGTILYFAAYVPVMPLKPICSDEAASSIFAPSIEVDGEMARPFLHEYHRMISGLDHLVHGGQIYVTLGTWFERDWLMNMSHRATARLLAERTGSTPRDVRDQRTGIPEFDEVRSFEWPPCDAMRKLAIEGGEWAYVGPQPNPEILRQRLERSSVR
jgi:hypothetical protein